MPRLSAEVRTFNIGGSFFNVVQPIAGESGVKWNAELRPSTWARFAVGTNYGIGEGRVVIRIAPNPSLTESRSVDLYLNGRLSVTLVQGPYEPQEAPGFWWVEMSPEDQPYYDTARFAEGEPGIGWVYYEAWPYIYSYALNSWLYIAFDSTPGSFDAYRFDENRWLWGSLQWGWYYDYSTGWSAF